MGQTIAQSLKAAEDKLKQAGIGSARLDTLILLEEATGKDRAHLLADSDKKLGARAAARFRSLLAKRLKHKPIAYILSYKEFYGLKLRVTPHALIPRPESEAVVETALSLHSKLNKKPTALLDVGTGCGAIAIAIAKQRPHWRVAASDISPKALRLAKLNAKLHAVDLTFHRSDLFGAITQRFNLITANLPYVRTGAELSPEGKLEPAVALYGGADGLDIYRRFLATAPRYLATHGYLVIEAEPRHHPALSRMATANHLQLVRTEGYALALRQNL